MGITEVDKEGRYDFTPACRMAVYKAFLHSMQIERYDKVYTY